MSSNHRIVCWQGWKLMLPRRWDPVKLEGDHSQGHALFADTLRPRLGLRWQTLKIKSKAPLPAGLATADKKGSHILMSTKLAMKNEVGQLAADEAREFAVADRNWQSPLLYIEPDPPGRDVFCVFSQASGRLLQVAYHAHRRENILAASILPTLEDMPMERAAPWSIFDLNCVIPGGMKLKIHRLNAGDLGLTFFDRFNELTVRQIAVAQLALARQSLDAWIFDQQKTAGRFHRSTGIFTDISVDINQQEFPARAGRMVRPARYALLWNLPRELHTIGLHDPGRDRLILLHGSDESLLREIARTVGTL